MIMFAQTEQKSFQLRNTNLKKFWFVFLERKATFRIILALYHQGGATSLFAGKYWIYKIMLI